MKLAVIPARGGSKRIPRKNIKPFAGRPMIAWSIEAALDSGIFDHVVVSTDDSEIANTALELGAEVPFVRPRELSGDLTATVPVVAHACAWVEGHWGPVASACCIYATAPFITSEDIVTAEKLLRDSHADYAFPVTSFPFPVQRAVRLQGTERMQMFYPEHANTRSQDLIEAFHDVGQFYWGKAEAWTQGRSIIGPDAAPLVIPRHRAQDIDTPEDWCRAELMFQVLHQLDGSVSM